MWTSARSTWSLAMDRGDVNASLSVLQSLSLSLSSDEGLLSTLPSWCSFQGMMRYYNDSILFYCLLFDSIRFDSIRLD